MTAANDDLLTQLLTAAGVTDGPVGVAELTALWDLLGIADDALRDEFVDTVAGLAAADMESVQDADPELHLRLGHWEIDLARQGIRTGILSAVAAAVLVHQGLTEFGVAFATAVLPAVFDIERIELFPGDRRLVTEIRLRYAYRQGFATEDDLYAALPAATREVINRYDFADFIGRLRAAGLTDETGGHRLRLREPDDPRPGLDFR
jgi:hypothetical protein